ncbi:hypothetical protein X753_30675 [Mesorhizobium sp. LNJC399B00]|nr:hypothetical protein X753_30675 [Mesorhizobium sp. LNJC399B00]
MVSLAPKHRAGLQLRPVAQTTCAGNDSFIGQLEQPALIVAHCRTHGRAKPRVHTCRLGRLHHQPVESRPVELPAGTLSGKHAVPLAGNFIGPHRNKRTIFNEAGLGERCPDTKLTQQPVRYCRQHLSRLWPIMPSCFQQQHAPRGCIVANASPDVVAAERDRLSELAGQNANLKIALARISEAD